MVVKLVALVANVSRPRSIGISSGRRVRISLTFTAFEAGMPIIGLGLGAPLGHAIGGTADYIAIGVLLAFGLYTPLASEQREEHRLAQFARLSGLGALIPGVGISLDELAVGFTLGLLRLPVGLVIALIALQAFILAQLGLRLGSRLSLQLREGAEGLAGVALAGLGVALLAEKLLG